VKKKAPSVSYDDLLRYASLNTNKQPIPKELAHVAESLRTNKPVTPTSASSNTSKKTLATPMPLHTTSNLKKPVPSSSIKTTTVIKNNSIKQPSIQSTSSNNKSKLNTSVSSSNNVRQPIRPPPSSTNRIMNGQKSTSQHQMFHVQRLPINRTINEQNRMMNVQRSSIVPCKEKII